MTCAGFGALIRSYPKLFRGCLPVGRVDLVIGTVLNLPLMIWYAVAVYALATHGVG